MVSKMKEIKYKDRLILKLSEKVNSGKMTECEYKKILILAGIYVTSGFD